jgi:hypothetical protein
VWGTGKKGEEEEEKKKNDICIYIYIKKLDSFFMKVEDHQ